jgi:hypothetical protein
MHNLENLRNRRKAAASLGNAPDGLPWRLSIDRGPSAADLLAPIAARLGYDAAPEYRETPLDEIATNLTRLFEQKDVKSIDTEDGSVDCYITSRPISSIIGPTLLARFTAQPTAFVFAAPGSARQDTRNAPTRRGIEAAPPVRADIGTGRLAIPLDGSQPLVVNRVDRTGALPSFRFLRRFQPESLAALKSARFDCNIPESGDRLEGPMSDLNAYREARREVLHSRQYCGLACRVDRSEIVQRLADVADQLHDFHKAGRIHGDLKPANILMTARGVRIIDSLDLAPGFKSPAMTPGWAAPEQIAGDDVQYATDQYALGLLLCMLLTGVVYGEEVTFVVPVGANKTEKFILLRNPGVYLPPDLAPLDAAGIAPWQGFLARCLRFSPADRFSTMADLAAELREVSGRAALSGQFEMAPWFGSLEEAPGNPELSWEIQDAWV